MAGKEGLAWLMPVLLLLGSVCGTAALGLRPRPGQPMLAVFPAWWDAARSFGAAAAAGGAVLRSGAWPGLLVVQAADADLPDRLRAAGAWLLLDPLVFGTCGTQTVRSS